MRKAEKDRRYYLIRESRKTGELAICGNPEITMTEGEAKQFKGAHDCPGTVTAKYGYYFIFEDHGGAEKTLAHVKAHWRKGAQ